MLLLPHTRIYIDIKDKSSLGIVFHHPLGGGGKEDSEWWRIL